MALAISFLVVTNDDASRAHSVQRERVSPLGIVHLQFSLQCNIINSVSKDDDDDDANVDTKLLQNARLWIFFPGF